MHVYSRTRPGYWQEGRRQKVRVGREEERQNGNERGKEEREEEVRKSCMLVAPFFNSESALK
jgi:hypothetical protein